MYAGAYAFGKTESRTKVINGRARKSEGHFRSRETWMVLIQNHHPGYISWEQFERNQAMLSDNAHMKSRMEPKAGRGGRSLLAGLLRCRRCGRMLHVAYSGTHGEVPRYHCRGAQINHGTDWCISFGGLKPDRDVAAEILKAVEGNAIEAALEVAARAAEQQSQRHRALSLELEQARYEARWAERQYNGVDPENRLVAGELERRWNEKLERVAELERAYAQAERDAEWSHTQEERTAIAELSQDLPAIWSAETTTDRERKQLLRMAIESVQLDGVREAGQIEIQIHWRSGTVTEHRVKRPAPGESSLKTPEEAVVRIHEMARRSSYEEIAEHLNRAGLRSAFGRCFTSQHVGYICRRDGVAKRKPRCASKSEESLDSSTSTES